MWCEEMMAIVFVKRSQRLPGKHNLNICGKKMIQMVCEILLDSKKFDEVIIYSKDILLKCDLCDIVNDYTKGVLIDSLIAAIDEYNNFLAVGGDMPFITSTLINLLLDEYVGKPAALISNEGIIEPLFAIYNKTIIKELKEYSSTSKSIYPFVSRRFMLINAGDLSQSLKSINTYDDLGEARKILGCY